MSPNHRSCILGQLSGQWCARHRALSKYEKLVDEIVNLHRPRWSCCVVHIPSHHLPQWHWCISSVSFFPSWASKPCTFSPPIPNRFYYYWYCYYFYSGICLVKFSLFLLMSCENLIQGTYISQVLYCIWLIKCNIEFAANKLPFI